MRLLALALAAWTRLPAAAAARSASTPQARALGLRYLPLAGAAVALPAAVAYAIAGLWLPHAVSLLVAFGVLTLLTGGIHERGLAAWCEDLAARTRTDGSFGAAGATGLMLVVLGRLEALSSIDPSWIAVTLVTAAVFSRGCAAFVLGGSFAGDGAGATAGTDPGTPGVPGGATGATGATGPIAFAIGLAPVIAAALWTDNLEGFGVAAGLSVGAAVLVRRTLAPRGLPRDERAVGAIQQLAELAFHLGILATLSIADETLADPAS